VVRVGGKLVHVNPNLAELALSDPLQILQNCNVLVLHFFNFQTYIILTDVVNKF
jgi:hypothetical protein